MLLFSLRHYINIGALSVYLPVYMLTCIHPFTWKFAGRIIHGVFKNILCDLFLNTSWEKYSSLEAIPQSSISHYWEDFLNFCFSFSITQCHPIVISGNAVLVYASWNKRNLIVCKLKYKKFDHMQEYSLFLGNTNTF